MPRPRLALALSFTLLAGTFACFPGYQVAGGDGDGDAGAPSDGSLPPTDGSGSSSGSSGGSSGSSSGSSSGGSSGGSSGSSGSSSGGGDGGAFDSSTQALVPRGAFTFIDPSGQAKTQASFSHDVLFDKYEVTVAEFDRWIQDGKPVPPDFASLDPGGPYADQIYWRPEWTPEAASLGYNDTANCTNAQAMESTEFDVSGPTYALYLASPATTARYPINCVSWYQAVAYCWYAGHKRLATEAEYQYEITGLTRGLTYPWGNAPPPVACDRAVWRGDGGSLNHWNGCGFPTPIGSAEAGASFDGVLDMQGSVEEWVWNRPNNEYPPAWTQDYAGPTNDAGPDPTRSARGGSWFTAAGEMDGKRYDSLGPTSVYTDLGIRCVQTKL